jgi:hypothetical protein
LRGGIYELRNGRPAQIYRNAADRISALTIAVNDLLYVTGGAEVYRLKQMRDREVILTVEGGRLTDISYAAFPSSEGEPCELTVELTGSNAGAISLFEPAISGPNLRWLTPDLGPHGGRIGPGRFRYFVLQGTYWVRMDTKADYPGTAPRPAIRQVNCTVSQAHAAFSF